MLYDNTQTNTASELSNSGSADGIILITATLVLDTDKPDFLSKMLGDDLVSIYFESNVYNLMGKLSSHQYIGGYWDFITLSNGGFYMRLQDNSIYTIVSPNGYEYECSVETASIVVNLFALNWMLARSDLSQASLKTIKAHYYHLLDFALQHKDVKIILDLID